MHRIPRGRYDNHNQAGGRPAALLLHGLYGTSFDYVGLGPETSLGFLLADRGYDVWMGNARGNLYARKHAKLDPDKDPAFWKFR